MHKPKLANFEGGKFGTHDRKNSDDFFLVIGNFVVVKHEEQKKVKHGLVIGI